MKGQYFVYITTNKTNNVLYTGFSSNLIKRIFQHKNKLASGFTSKYNVNKLVYFEVFLDPLEAIAREQQTKAGSRKKKLDLIKLTNPDFSELYDQITS